jgi:hypothetical protein
MLLLTFWICVPRDLAKLQFFVGVTNGKRGWFLSVGNAVFVDPRTSPSHFSACSVLKGCHDRAWVVRPMMFFFGDEKPEWRDIYYSSTSSLWILSPISGLSIHNL